MFFVRVENGSIVEWPITNLRSRFPNTSFVEPIEEQYLPVGYYIVHSMPRPPEIKDHEVQQGIPIYDGEQWVEDWKYVPFDDAKLKERHELKENEVRSHRNRLLADCDWTQLSDSDADQSVWRPYRRALKDITRQPGYPFEIVWPQPPKK